MWSPPLPPSDGVAFDAVVGAAPAALTEEELREALDTVAALRARLDGAAAALVGSFDHRAAWSYDGAKGTTAWLTARRHGSHGACRSEVDVARAVRSMPAVEAAARAGRLSREKVRALAWARQPGLEEVFAACEEQLVREVEAPTVAGAWRYLRRWVEAMRMALGVAEPEGPEPTDGVGGSKVSLATGLEGRWFGSLDLTAEDGELLATAVDDQIGRMWAHRAFTKADGLTVLERRAIALLEVVRRGTRGGGDDRTARPLILGITDLETLLGSGRHAAPDDWADDLLSGVPSALREGRRTEGQGAGDVVMALSELSRSGPVDIEVLRRLACEGDILPVILGKEGKPLEMGRAIRIANRHQRRALRLRDGHCTFAGCSVPGEQCVAHHLVYWEQGGLTDLAYLALVCRFHHKVLHHAGFRLEWLDGVLVTLRPDGTPITDPAPDDVPLLQRHHVPDGHRRRRQRGTHPDGAADDPETLFFQRAARRRADALIALSRSTGAR